MEAHTVSTAYMSGKVYIIWEVPHDKITGYEVIRNGVVIASSLLGNSAEFVQPTLFDHDHHTNLFRKDSTNKLMFVDETIQRYQHYEYQVIAKRLDVNNNVMEQIKSDLIYTQAL